VIADTERYSAKRHAAPASAGRPRHASLVYPECGLRSATCRRQGGPAFTSHGSRVTSHIFPVLGSQPATLNCRPPLESRRAQKAQKRHFL